MKLKIVFWGILLISASQLLAQPGSLDTTFNVSGPVKGKVFLNYGYSEQANAVAVDGSGRILTASYDPSYNVIFLTRLRSDGTIDTLFGSLGTATLNTYPTQIPNALAVQPDGNILLAGYLIDAGGNTNMLIARYRNDGSLDPSFGTGGIRNIDMGGYDIASAIDIQSDGNILLAGTSNGKAVVTRLMTADGSTDLSNFNPGSGYFISPGFSENVAALVYDGSSGNIFVAGDFYNAGYNNMFVICLTSGGTLNPSFGTGGKTTINLLSSDFCRGLIYSQALRRLYVAGSTGGQFRVVGLDQNGAPDNNFNGTGVFTRYPVVSGGSLSGILMNAKGDIFLTGTAGGASPNYATMKIDGNGNIDSTYGDVGTATI
ncbi:MAG: hypothetical protein K2X86_16815, partial [Cytophagaceae bacterium]|nr:hypothetical protein [Cytophagaceae bacterium]